MANEAAVLPQHYSHEYLRRTAAEDRGGTRRRRTARMRLRVGRRAMYEAPPHAGDGASLGPRLVSELGAGSADRLSSRSPPRAVANPQARNRSGLHQRRQDRPICFIDFGPILDRADAVDIDTYSCLLY